MKESGGISAKTTSYLAAHQFEASSLTLAREFRGLLKKELAEKVQITASAVTQLESGRLKPNPSTLAKLSLTLGFPVDFFTRPVPEDISSDRCHFRSLRSSSQQERLRMVSASKLVGRLVRLLEDYVEFPSEHVTRLHSEALLAGRDLDNLAERVRGNWGLGLGPLPNVVRLLEGKGIIVSRLLSNCSRVDAFCVFHSDRPLVFLNAEKGNFYRSRFDAAHELGHLVMHQDCMPGDPDQEHQANQFAAAFLFPRESFLSEFPRRLVWPHLEELRDRWGMSLSAIVRRGFNLGLISKATYTRANMFLRSSGLDMQVSQPPEKPSVLTDALRQLQDLGTTLSVLAGELALRETDLSDLFAA